MTLHNFKAIGVAVFTLLFLTACSDDDNNESLSGKGSITLKFDNIYDDADFAFNTPYANSNGNVITSNSAIYIISNVQLTDENGNIYTVPKSDSYFLINEADADAESTIKVTIADVPAGNYTKIAFGIGVDKEQWQAGVDGQGDLLEKAQSLGMTWSWAAGYKFIKFEGDYTSNTTTEAAQFKVHTGKTGDVYNYAETVVDLPTSAKVRTDVTPAVHIMTDLSKL